MMSLRRWRRSPWRSRSTGTIEIAGPDQIRLDALVRQYLNATGETRQVVTDDSTGYFGIEVNDQSLVPGVNARLGSTHYKDWLKHSKR